MQKHTLVPSPLIATAICIHRFLYKHTFDIKISFPHLLHSMTFPHTQSTKNDMIEHLLTRKNARSILARRRQHETNICIRKTPNIHQNRQQINICLLISVHNTFMINTNSQLNPNKAHLHLFMRALQKHTCLLSSHRLF